MTKSIGLLILSLTVSFLIGGPALQAQEKYAFFPDYYPVDPAVYGTHQMKCTFGATGEYTSRIAGTFTTPYQSGAITAAQVTGVGGSESLYPGESWLGIANDGSTVRLYTAGGSITTGEYGYGAGDCQLAAPAAGTALSGLYDGMVYQMGPLYMVQPDLSGCQQVMPQQRYVVSIQDVKVTQGYYQDAVVIWLLDLNIPFAPLNFSGQIGMQGPSTGQTGGFSVTAFEVFGLNTGMIASGNIDAASGNLVELWQLQSIQRPVITTALPLVSAYPHLALGGGYQGVLLISNKTNFPWEGEVLLRQGNHQNWTPPWSLDGQPMTGETKFAVALAPRASKEFIIDSDNTIHAGYLQVLSKTPAPSISTTFFYNYLASVQQASLLIDSTGTPAGTPGRRFWFPVRKTGRVNTGFAFTGTREMSGFNVTMILFDAAGQERSRLSLPFEGHTARFFASEIGLFPDVPDGFTGSLLIESPEPLLLVVLRIETVGSSFQMTSIPPDQGQIQAY